jgi:homoserine acetyltransferase
MVAAELALTDALGISHYILAVGPSLGGMPSKHLLQSRWKTIYQKSYQAIGSLLSLGK